MPLIGKGPGVTPDKPLVSVIIPFLNAERFIQEAIESVLAQTYDHWELLLVDDGSTDGSTHIARRYGDQYPTKVHRLEHAGRQNRGISASRNLGVRNARGQYIAFLDADDVWLPQKLTQQVATLDSRPEAAMIYGNSLYWYGWTGNPEDKQRDYLPDLGFTTPTLVSPPRLLALYLRGRAAVPCPCSLLIRRAALERVGGFEDAFPHLYEDQVLYAKLLLAEPVLVAPHCWDRYRQHRDSVCSVADRSGRLRAARLVYLNWLTEYLRTTSVTDREVWRALEGALWPYRHPLLAGVLAPARRGLSRAKRAWRRVRYREGPTDASFA